MLAGKLLAWFSAGERVRYHGRGLAAASLPAGNRSITLHWRDMRDSDNLLFAFGAPLPGVVSAPF